MGDNREAAHNAEPAQDRGRGLKRTPVRRHSTGSDAVPDAAATFQTPRLTMQSQELAAWGKPKISTYRISNTQDRMDAEKWATTLQALPLYGVTMTVGKDAVQT